MADRLDELLRSLPVEAMSSDLPARILLQLQTRRSRERRAQRMLDIALIGMVLLGIAALAPQISGAAVPSLGTLEGSADWVGQLGTAPAPAVWTALTEAFEWTAALAGSIGVEGLLGLTLLTLPLFIWLWRVMPDRASAPGWQRSTLEEGAAA